jgi:DNA (cytosine-5)-methyltransferase 1
MLKIGSLCTGYGGLDMAVEEYFNAETVWVSEIDKYASQVIELRINKPNLGDFKKIDWALVEPIDILTAGYPCQPFSHAGNRKGTDDARHIWPNIKEGISILRPSYVILENVRGHLSLGFKEVLKDLAEIGYDAKWQVIRASDVGAPHRRERIFIIATPQCSNPNSERCALESNICRALGHQRQSQSQLSKLEQETAKHTFGEFEPPVERMQRMGRKFATRFDMHLQPIPNPLDQDGKLNPKFVEYMMGLPEGWVTDTELSRAQQLKMLGNGVVPQQALFALSQIMR